MNLRGVVHATLVAMLIASFATLFVSAALRMGARQIDFTAYGQTVIPGQGPVDLPAGEVVVSLHAAVDPGKGEPTGPLPVPPDLKLTVLPATGVAVTKNVGNTHTADGHRFRPVWQLTLPADGTYTVSSVGSVDFPDPGLAFGDEGWRHEYVRWMLIASLTVTLATLALLFGVFWRRPAG